MRILIVEDELPVARQIAAALTEDGHDPKAVHSGEAALEELSKGPFDLIVVDVGLPGINGFELLAAPARTTSCQSCTVADRAQCRRRSSNRLATRGRRLFAEAICHA